MSPDINYLHLYILSFFPFIWLAAVCLFYIKQPAAAAVALSIQITDIVTVADFKGLTERRSDVSYDWSRDLCTSSIRSRSRESTICQEDDDIQRCSFASVATWKLNPLELRGIYSATSNNVCSVCMVWLCGNIINSNQLITKCLKLFGFARRDSVTGIFYVFVSTYCRHYCL